MVLAQKVYTKETMPYLAILANKADLTHMRAVRPAQHVDFADLHKMHRYDAMLLPCQHDRSDTSACKADVGQ